ncbi:glutamine--tRNA ligase/YqeY domain fusion protein [Reinekea marinisedimentorum]|uniref:Glutamine--tRNA ligase n=1 Tax=Reinekea marinisedimentorum TaxID=230495 RepID=A0A4R3HVM3_9GAMM|nr:glutamine--tRNA ligase/YqeY domain fusion protein [Reinekea marinisedimentorum]TCS36125.1 glutaminyl-tRNA synthetase [Reinekea marinisedimentorum]
MTEAASNFLRTIIDNDLKEGKHETIVTRFPPEPNGFLHIGHAKAICINFGLAQEFQGQTNLRFDDTNPEKEEQAYVDAIKEDVEWLGFKWAGNVKYTSDYFDTLYEWALHLIKTGKAYVCDLNAEQIREYRGSLTEPGKDSPFRERSVDENLALFEQMKNGEFDEGTCSLRAKIDMASPNVNLRDPIIYRIRKVAHHQTGDKWCIYPSYDFAHGQGDAIEGVTHSLCSLEFEDHRPLYNWFIENLPVPHKPRQIEFARLNLNYTVTSKRKLKKLVDENIVDGWDDPRMPTVSGMRRRGVTPRAIRNFIDASGISRAVGTVVDLGMLEAAIRDDLNENAPRAMAVLKPLKVVLTNLPKGHEEVMTQPVHPQKPELGEREIPFSNEVYIDVEDFNEDNTLSRKKFKRLVPGDYVRLRGAYIIKAESFSKDEDGNVTEIQASVVEGSVGENVEGVKPRGVIQWVSVKHAVPAIVRVYDRLFNHETPDKGDNDFMEHINPNSLEVLEGCFVEPSLKGAKPEQSFQFEREGYFVVDRYDSTPERLEFNKTIGLRDVWERKA